MERITMFVSGLLVVLGLVIVAQTAAAGVGGGLGFLLGACFVLAGALRLYLLRAARRP